MYKDATRSLSGLSSPFEKRALIWMARRMPLRINADHLTLLAFASMLLCGLSYWLARASRVGLVLAIACLALNWFGDSLDGTLARVRNQQRPRYGFYVDHIVDAFGALFLLGGVALSGYMTPIVAASLLAAYFLVCVETFLATHTLGVFKMTHFGVGPTELRAILAIGNLVLLVHPMAQLFGRELLLFDVGGIVAAIGLVGIATISAVRHTSELYRAERL